MNIQDQRIQKKNNYHLLNLDSWDEYIRYSAPLKLN